MTAECHAAVDDPQGFKDTLLRHDAELQGFCTKWNTGLYSVPGRLNDDLLRETPEALIDATSRALADIAEAKSALLIYDISHRPGKPELLCVWLLSTSGLVAAENTEALAGVPAAYLARQALSVDSRAAARVPVPLRVGHETGRPTAETSSTSSPHSLRELSNALLPPSVQQKLVEGEFHRLLILPVADIGTVPWPALPIGDKMIVDRLVVVILADIDWIMQGTRNINRAFLGAIVVGDPDLSKCAPRG